MKQFVSLFIAIVLLTPALESQSLDAFFAGIASLPTDQRQAVADSFMAARRTMPVFENDTSVVFIAQREAASIHVTGDATGWKPNSDAMSRVVGTNLWYCRKTFEPDARLDYKFVVNGTAWVLDERNPLTCPGGFGPNSELRMPRYVEGPELKRYADIPHGTIHDTVFSSSQLVNIRPVRIYTPPGYEASKDSLPVILFHDGTDYITLGRTNDILDNLIWQKRIRPVIAVFVPPVNRNDEYIGIQRNQFSEFIVTTVMRTVDSLYRTQRSPAERAVLGASNGGNISLWLGTHYPHVFGNVGAQSSSIVSWLFERFGSDPKLNLKLYLDLGTYDIPILMAQVRKFVPILQAKQYNYLYREYHEGHSWGNWREHLDDALEFFFGTAPGSQR